VAAITRRAHEVGAFVVADLYQSAGTVPVDVTAWDVDFATGGSVKWLCGGPGAAYLYVNPRLHNRLRPRMTGWAAHPRPFAFELEHEWAEGAARFLHGTPGVPALYAALGGYDMVGRIGVTAIREKSVRQVSRLVALAEDKGLRPRVAPRWQDRGGMVVLDLEHGEAVTRELLRRETLVDYRPGAGIRVSPHFYTSDEELTAVVDDIRRILDDGTWETHERAGGTGF
jgi:kynureninase